MQILVICKLANQHIFTYFERLINYLQFDTKKINLACLVAEILMNQNIYAIFALGDLLGAKTHVSLHFKMRQPPQIIGS